ILKNFGRRQLGTTRRAQRSIADWACTALPPTVEEATMKQLEPPRSWRHARWLFWVVTSLCVLVTISSCGGDDGARRPAADPQVANTPTPAPTAAPTATPDKRPPLERTMNILLLGSDKRGSDPNWRTDTIMIVALDLAAQKVGIISIPRDVYLEEIPNHDPNRINVVDYLGETDEPNGGGPKLLASLIAEHMGIRIDHYLRFGFDGFQKVIDAVGGVDVDVECSYSDSMAGLYIKPGHHKMDGPLALKYVRSRYTTNDLDRNRRQQQVIWAVRQAVVEKNLLPRIPAIYAAVAGSVQTDIDLVTAVRLIRFGLALEPRNVYSLSLAPPELLTPGWRYGMDIFVPDWPAISFAAQRIFERPSMTAAEIAGAQGETPTCY
ncbi:MAG TPA: LCP family protein, partial [Caldilineaceae bacterium]|nr:LCP family protein [Caldilineaceae bacterium]